MAKTIFLAIIVAVTILGLATSSIALNSIAEAAKGDVKESIKADLKIQQKGSDVVVKVKAKGLEPNESFTVRAYTDAMDCGGPPAEGIGTDTSDKKGKLKISGTIIGVDVDDVESVSIRSTGPPPDNPPVVCFQNTT